ncbi:MAG: trypsin-like peptidase domain-containing protein [Bdellovibrionota bacterium]
MTKHTLAKVALITSLVVPGAAQAAAPEPSDPNVYVQLAERAVPSVVNISTMKVVKSPFLGGDPNDPFRQFFEGRISPHPRNEPRAYALGSGFVIDPSGIILTNNHVVAGADEIKIAFTESNDEVPTDGKVIARDSDLDIALIRVKTKRPLTALPLGDSEKLKVGEYVAAVGNPFGQGHSISHGIVSAKGRQSPDFPLATWLQTDAPINPGNSGGPLLNLRGEVIGINNAIDARAQGIGFAIPINAVKKELAQLESGSTIARGYLGVMIAGMNPELARQLGAPEDLKAPVVMQVDLGTPAFRAGVRPYDVIKKVDGKAITSPAELTSAVSALTEGQKAALTILRSGKEESITVRLGHRPQAQES